jgi:biotin-(acetyl-CoA carboxylase) ligase
VEGVAEGIDAEGRLAVRRSDERIELVRAGTVVLERI